MSEIDRISEKWALKFTNDLLANERLRYAFEMAMHEYGQIVREECAKIAISHRDPEDSEYSADDTQQVAYAIANAIRNAGQILRGMVGGKI